MTTSPIDAQLAVSGAISGTVTDDTSQPLSDICVDVTQTNGPSTGQAFTDSNGEYTINSGLRQGTYKVKFSDCLGTTYVTEWFDNRQSETTADLLTGQRRPDKHRQRGPGGDGADQRQRDRLQLDAA